MIPGGVAHPSPSGAFSSILLPDVAQQDSLADMLTFDIPPDSTTDAAAPPTATAHTQPEHTQPEYAFSADPVDAGGSGAMPSVPAGLGVAPVAKSPNGSVALRFVRRRWKALTVWLLALLVGVLLAVRFAKRGTSSSAPAPSTPTPPKPKPRDRTTVGISWEATSEPTERDKVVFFDVSNPKKSWQCCASRIFAGGTRHVSIDLPAGDYAARTIHRDGMQQVCSLESAKRVAFTDTASRCSGVEPEKNAKRVDLSECEEMA